ncbi:hypothetical protein DPV78_008858 [Talaromyces pinophilus]|nr:hypothetical protein DPV78_008858 [Talaromyces pinophilus]
MEPLFSNPSRVVTGHDDQGNSIYIDDKQIPMFRTPFNCDFAVLYQTTKFPADLNGEWKDPLVRIPGSSSSDSAVASFHRTVSLDFGVVFEGEMTCYLDKGVEITFKKGDLCVQRGTIHGWENKADKPARIYFFVTDCIRHSGQTGHCSWEDAHSRRCGFWRS